MAQQQRHPNRSSGTPVAGTHFYVQPLRLDRGKLVLGQMRESRNANAAIDTARELSGRFPAVVACEVELDEDGNAIDAPRILAKHGDVPGIEEYRV